MEILTRKQKSIFVYIRDFIAKEGHPPTLEEIRKSFNFASASTADYYVKNLCKKGFLSQESGKMRTIQILKNIENNFKALPILISKRVVPILGSANAGEALLVAEENESELIEVPTSIVNNENIFALRLDGDSMNKCKVSGKYLLDGSIIFIDPTKISPEPNDIVLMIINGHATIKRFTIDTVNNQVKLIPVSSNPKHKSIILTAMDDFVVNGKVIGVL